MIRLTKELKTAMKEFRERFDDVVPLMELPGSVTTPELMEAIGRCLRENENLLPRIFGYGEIESDPTKDI